MFYPLGFFGGGVITVQTTPSLFLILILWDNFGLIWMDYFKQEYYKGFCLGWIKCCLYQVEVESLFLAKNNFTFYALDDNRVIAGYPIYRQDIFKILSIQQNILL